MTITTKTQLKAALRAGKAVRDDVITKVLKLPFGATPQLVGIRVFSPAAAGAIVREIHKGGYFYRVKDAVDWKWQGDNNRVALHRAVAR